MDRINRRTFEKEWGYGWIFFGYEVNERTINYIIKYITKRDEDNPEFNGKIFTSKRIGIGYINKNTLRRHRYQDKFTEETYRTESGIKAALPMYYKQKIWTDQEREALRIIKEEKQTRYYNKTGYRDWETDRKSTRLNSSHITRSRMPSSA